MVVVAPPVIVFALLSSECVFNALKYIFGVFRISNNQRYSVSLTLSFPDDRCWGRSQKRTPGAKRNLSHTNAPTNKVCRVYNPPISAQLAHSALPNGSPRTRRTSVRPHPFFPVHLGTSRSAGAIGKCGEVPFLTGTGLIGGRDPAVEGGTLSQLNSPRPEAGKPLFLLGCQS